jgi:spore germination protein YaaH
MFNLWFLLCFLSLVAGGGRETQAPGYGVEIAPKLVCAVPLLQRAAVVEAGPPMTELTPAQPAAGPNTDRSYRVAIWATYAGFLEQETLAANAGVVDEVNFVWYTLESGGKISGSIQSPEALQAARAAGLRVVPSIANAGFSRDAVIEAIGEPAARTGHVQELAMLVEENDFGGIDIDYESLVAEDR